MIRKVIENLKNKNSVGTDGISIQILKYIKEEISGPLAFIINQCLKYSIFPEKLKIAKITPIYKGGDSSFIQNYRPIAVLSTLSKVFEKIMYQQINNYFTSNNLFNKNQYGFRENHSTEYAAVELADKVFSQLDKRNIPLNVYLDLSKAFDSIDHSILLEKLKYYGFTEKSIQLIQSYLYERKQCVEINHIKSEFLLNTRGVPQGSILGPLLFIIYVNDMPNSTDYFDFILYADDTTLCATRSLNDITNQTTANIWCKAINNELTKVMTGCV